MMLRPGALTASKAFGPLGLGTTEKWDTQREARGPCRSAVCSVWCACGLGVSGRAVAVVQKRTTSLKYFSSRLLFLVSLLPCLVLDDNEGICISQPYQEEDKNSLVVNSIALSHEHGLIPTLSHDTNHRPRRSLCALQPPN